MRGDMGDTFRGGGKRREGWEKAWKGGGERVEWERQAERLQIIFFIRDLLEPRHHYPQSTLLRNMEMSR